MPLPNARALLAQVIGAALVTDIDPELDLRSAGVGSGDMIRLSLLVEEVCGAGLTEDDLEDLHTLADIDQLFARMRGLPESALDERRQPSVV